MKTPKPRHHHHLTHHVIQHVHGITLDQVAAWAGILGVVITILGILNSSRIRKHFQDKKDEKRFGPVFKGSMSRARVRKEIKWKDEGKDDDN